MPGLKTTLAREGVKVVKDGLKPKLGGFLRSFRMPFGIARQNPELQPLWNQANDTVSLRPRKFFSRDWQEWDTTFGERFHKMSAESQGRALRIVSERDVVQKPLGKFDLLEKGLKVSDEEMAVAGALGRISQRTTFHNKMARVWRQTNPDSEQGRAISRDLLAQSETLPQFMPRLREGQFVSAVTGKKGELLAFDKSLTQKEALQRAGSLRNNLDGYNKGGFENVQEYFRKNRGFEGVESKVYSSEEFVTRFGKNLSVSDVLEMRENGLITNQAAEQVLEGIKKLGKQFSFVHRKNIPGFKDDPVSLMKGVLMGHERSVYAHSRAAGFTRMRGLVSKIQPGPLQRHGDEFVDGLMNQTPEWARNTKKWIYGWHLGANFGFFFQNMTQSFLNTLPEIAKFTGGAKAGKIYFDAGKESMALVRAQLRNNFSSIADREMVRMTRRAVKEGVIADPMTRFLYGQTPKEGIGARFKFRTAVDEFTTVAGRMSERLLRTNAFVAGVRVGKEKGLAGRDLYEFGKQFTISTQFPFGVHNTPLAISRMAGSMRGVADLAFTYRTFRLNQIERIVEEVFGSREFTVAGHKFQRAIAGRVAQMMTPVIMSGTKGIIGWNLFKHISNRYGNDPDVAIRQWINNITLPEAMSAMVDNTLGAAGIHPDELKGKTGELVTRGIAGFSGIAPDKWIAMGDLPVSPYEEPLGVVSSMPASAIRAVSNMMKGRGWEGGVGALPAVMRGPATVLKWVSEGGVRAQDGELIYMPSTWNKIVRALNIPPLGPSKAFETRHVEKSMVSFQKRRTAILTEQLSRAMAEGDKLRAEAIRERIRQHNIGARQGERIQISPQALRDRIARHRRGRSLRRVPRRLRRRVRELRALP